MILQEIGVKVIEPKNDSNEKKISRVQTLAVINPTSEIKVFNLICKWLFVDVCFLLEIHNVYKWIIKS